MKGRLAHVRIYSQAMQNPQTLIFNRFFDITSYNKYMLKYFPLDNSNDAQYVTDYKTYSTNVYEQGMVYANIATETTNTTLSGINNMVDDYNYTYKALKLKNPSIASFTVATPYNSWCIDFMY